MNIYRLTQDIHTSYDTYDSCVVCADSADEAKQINPAGELFSDKKREYEWGWGSWADNPEQVLVTLIGVANDDQAKGVILSSFNAG